MDDPRDVVSLGVGAYTAGVGGLTLIQVQTLMGIIATFAGIVLTVATFVWRRREHHRRMKGCDKPDDRGKP